MHEVGTGDTYAALKVAWENLTSLAGLNGPFRDEAPANPAPAFPYVVFQGLPAGRTQRSNTSEYWTERFQFVVYTRLPEEAERWVAKIGGALGPVVLQYHPDTLSAMVAMDKVREHIVADNDRKVVRGLMEYQVVRRRPRSDK
jgi:hypothetical protein